MVIKLSDIILKNVSKEIKGKQVLNDISYTFKSGTIYGLKGRNGCGKTMLLRAISGLIVTKGEIVIVGKKVGEDIEFPESIGIIIENMSLLPEHTAFENLKILSKIKKVANDDDIKKTLLAVGLEADSKKKVKTFSLGMKQKLNIAQAIFENPDILLLDEPTNALDTETIKNIRNILLKMKEQGKTIIIASHNDEDLNILADEIILIVDGSIRKEDI